MAYRYRHALVRILPVLAAVGCAAFFLAGRSLLAAAPAPVSASAPAVTPQTPAAKAAGTAIQYRTETRTVPRPLHIHFLEIDLTAPEVELLALPATDPDGPAGPAQAMLESPLAIMARYDAVAAVNANAFSSLPDAAGKRDTKWFEGKPVTICGWAVHDGRQINPPAPNLWNLWRLPSGRVQIGHPLVPEAVKEAVAGFGGLLQDGKILPAEDGVLHPRTAAGTDQTGKKLWLAVVDGRQKGYSEGMSTRELAALMLSLGCTDALNLDGGGSSIMIYNPPGAACRQVLNRPSGGSPRPVPVMLGVRLRAP